VITVYGLRCDEQNGADVFFAKWGQEIDGGFYAVRLDLSEAEYREPEGSAEHPLHWWLELPGVWFGQEGQLIRAYNETTATAYNAWQIDEWVTIIAVEGIPTRALPLAREVKEVVTETYRP
jgi:hypothetical protein